MPCKTCGKEGHNATSCQEKKGRVENSTLSCSDFNPDRFCEPTKLKFLKKELIPFPLDPCVKEKLVILADICKEVARTLKKGRVEVVYQAAVCQELQLRHIPFVSEETIQILYKGKFVGIERIDVSIGESFLPFVYEFKATSTDIKPENLWQVISYLNHKGYNYGAVVNFTQNVKGCLEIQFVIRKEGVWHLVDIDKEVGEPLADYCY